MEEEKLSYQYIQDKLVSYDNVLYHLTLINVIITSVMIALSVIRQQYSTLIVATIIFGMNIYIHQAISKFHKEIIKKKW